MKEHYEKIYKEKLTYAQQYQELQDMINTIITTAKLIGHKVKIDQINTTIITKQNDITPFMLLSLHKESYNITLITLHDESNKTLKLESQETKINHLKDLLQAL